MNAESPSQVATALGWRYATKEFDPSRTIPAETWDVLRSSLVLAPSSFGLQPWQFLVIEDPALREQLQTHSWNQPQVTAADKFIVLAARTDITEADVDRWIEVLAVARGTTPDTLGSLRNVITGFVGGMEPAGRHAWSVRQVYLALGQLMTSAAMLGVDTCPLEGLNPAAYDETLGLTGSGFATAVACALGYRDPGDKYASMPKARFAADEVMRSV